MESGLKREPVRMAQFRGCAMVLEQERRMRIRQIYIKDRKKEQNVIMRPAEYIKYVEGIRSSLREREAGGEK